MAVLSPLSPNHGVIVPPHDDFTGADFAADDLAKGLDRSLLKGLTPRQSIASL